MKSISIVSRVENGKLRQNNALLRETIRKFEGKEIEITIKRKYKQRSLPQNKFYWGVIIPLFQQLILDNWGEIKDKEEIHEVLKYQCNYEERANLITGEITKIPKSTTELTTFGWLEYEQKIRQFAMDFFNTTLPEPNEQLEFEF